MNWLENFESIKVEITSHCNAKCPGCTRNVTGGKNVSNLDLNHMPLELWQRIMHKDTKGMNLKQVLFDGNVGDLLMHPQAIDFVKTTLDAHPKCHIDINTNGGARNELFWQELGKTLSNVPHRVNFAVDGLEDTHHIHRRNTTYDMVVRNIKAFANAGGQANWVMTLFDHNLHQQQEAEKRAVDAGVTWFQIRHSCISGEYMYTKTDTEEYAIGTENIYDHKEKITLKKLMIPSVEVEEHEAVKCTAYREKQIQIDFRGILWPCSYIYATETFNDKPLAMSPFYIDSADPSTPQMEHPGSNLSLYKHSLKEILTNDFFTNQLPAVLESKKLNICNKWCFN